MTNPGHPIALRRVFGLRLLFDPGSRQSIALVAAGTAMVAFIVHAVNQLATLGTISLKYDYQQYFDAGQALNRGGDPYLSFINRCGAEWCRGGYIYPPPLAELFRPLALLSPHTGAFIWLLITYLLLGASIYLADRAVGRSLSPTARASLLLAALVFLPLYKSYFFLQINTLMLLILTVAAVAFVRGSSDGWAGAVLGLAAVIRVTPVLQAPMLLRNREALRRPTGVAGMLLAAVLILGLMAALTPSTWEYFTTVLPRLGKSTPNLDNLSLPGLIVRAEVLTVGRSLPLIGLVSVMAQLAVLGTTWLLSLNLEGPHPRAIVFAAFLAASPIISSITWDHHLVSELLVLVLLAPSLRSGGAPWWLALLGYLLMWLPRGITDGVVQALGLAQPQGPAVVPFLLITAVNLLGMILLWLACLDLLAGYRRAMAGPTTR